MLTFEQFIEHLRDALDHLYDPDQLQSNVLNGLLSKSSQTDAPSALRKILSEAIESLEPEETTPAQSRAWRLYELLVCRYLQQASVQEVAHQLGISHRHLRREQNAALEMLARRLWGQLGLNAEMLGDSTQFSAEPIVSSPTVDEELSWLTNLPAGRVSDLNEILSSVSELVHSLAIFNRVTLTTKIATGELSLDVHPIAVRQLLLSLFSSAIARIPGGSLFVSAKRERSCITVQVVGRPSNSGLSPASHDESAGLQVVQKLASLSRVEIGFSTEANIFKATLTFPTIEQISVLAIDDNADTLALLERYTEGTRYYLLKAMDPTNVLRVAKQTLPQIIVLDVMMPKTDGWEVLAQLRQHPLTSNTPIIVCSILAIEGLALSLGATGYVRKPITQSAFLDALDQQTKYLEITPH